MRKLNSTCEICCDAQATENMSDKEKEEYCKLLLELSTQTNGTQFVTFFRGKNLKQRILYVMKTKKISRKIKLFVLSTLTLICIGGVMPILAYEGPTVLKLEWDSSSVNYIDDSFAGHDLSFSNNVLPAQGIKIQYDRQFVDENGNLYNADIYTQASCEHNNCASGLLQAHRKKDDGSCNLKIYNAKRCNDCGMITGSSMISDTYFPRCIH